MLVGMIFSELGDWYQFYWDYYFQDVQFDVYFLELFYFIFIFFFCDLEFIFVYFSLFFFLDSVISDDELDDDMLMIVVEGIIGGI